MSIEQQLLPALARQAIEQALGAQPDSAPRSRQGSGPEDEDWLQAPGASFVTLTQQGRLRGCIGTGREQRMQCDLCPRDCAARGPARRLLRAHARRASAMVLTTYGRSSGFCIDPIEKKPLNHFHPGSAACCPSAPQAATSPASSARTGTSASRATWTG
jgi:hypothetical protein